MDMDDYANQLWDRLGKYELIGLILHKGKNMECGHYNALTRRLDGSWWFCNDSEIKQVSSEEHVLHSKKSVYLLVYRKVIVEASNYERNGNTGG